MELICAQLPTRDLAALRATCRGAHRLTHVCFAQRYAEYSTDFSEPSLQHLHALALNPLVRRHIRHLVVLSPEPRLGKDLRCRRAAAGHLRRPLEMPLLRTLRDDLARRLPHCRSFIISPILPAGSPAVEGEGESAPPADPPFNPDDVASILWEIIADAALPVQLFWYGRGMNYTSEVMDIARLPKGLFRHPGFRAGWATLENLHLEQTLTPQNYTFLLDLLLHAPALRKLHLSLGDSPIAVEFFADLSRAVDFAPALERLSLWATAIAPEDLVRLLGKTCASLKRLILRAVTGVDYASLAYLHQHHRRFPRLTTLDLNAIRGKVGLVRFTPAQHSPAGQAGLFQLEKNDQGAVPSIGLGPDDVVGASYTGPEMGQALDVLVHAWTESAGLQ
ncbi:hypothetical protein BO71DRAFT_366106 [Aspergillus ellipticus CBS 707.79]|uniref:F-box domain-containing protein n=1 Tax=Aspergillus ellipticus CBS 707.79 TaxID=1448320 RepID=A0A319DAG7_9EURO|nr:hypothetical protein BO71DRAFT_366106 [Aspergillus ellipticus CBS 707.79]